MDFTPEEIKRFKARRQAELALAQPQAQTPQTRGRGGIATSLISEGAGTGGALGGAALGASLGSVVPGIGTLIGGGIGGLLGGFAGGFGGRAVENKVRDDEYRLEDALSEGLLSGAFGAVGGAGRAYKGLKAAKNVASGVGKTGKELAKTAQKTAGSNSLTRQGRELYRSTLGVDDIMTPGKTKPLTIFRADELVDSAQKYGLRGSPKAMQRQAAVKFEELGAEAASRAANLTDTFSVRGANGIIPKINKVVAQDLPIAVDGVTVKRELARVANEFSEFTSKGKINASGLVGMKERLSSRLSTAFTKLSEGKDLTAKELVDMKVWQELDDLMPNAVKSITREQSKLYGLSQGLATQTRSLGQPSTLFDLGSRMVGRPIQATQNLAGRGLSAAGGVIPQVPNVGAGVGRQLATGTALRGINNQANAFQQPQQPLGLEDALMEAQNSPLPQQAIDGTYPEDLAQQSPYPRENLMYDIQRDPKNAEEYIKQFQLFQELFPEPEAPELTSVQETRAAAAQNALQDIPLIEESILSGKLGGAKNIPGSGTALGRRLLGTEDLDAALFNIADNILRARSGAAAPEAEVLRFKNTFLPGALDSQEAKFAKLQRAIRELQGYTNPTAAASGSLEDTILSLQEAL